MLYRLPTGIVVGLILIWGIIQGLNSSFLSSRNLVNLATQCAADGTIAVGVVLVLLVAQIDLSVGSMSGVASSILGVGLTTAGWPLPVAITVALAAGAVVGVTYAGSGVCFNVSTFVGTLAGFALVLLFVFEVSAVLDSLAVARLIAWAEPWQPTELTGGVSQLASVVRAGYVAGEYLDADAARFQTSRRFG